MKRRDFLKILGVGSVLATVPVGKIKSVKNKKRGGKTMFVDSSKGCDFFNNGTNVKRPLSTIDAALDRAEDGAGDTLIILPSHFEITEAPIIIDKGNITISGADISMLTSIINEKRLSIRGL